MLDEYLHGSVERLNPEAPGVVVKLKRREYRLGGAGAVAAMCRAHGAGVSVLGAVGDDLAGRRVKMMLVERGCAWAGITHKDGRPTTVKTRTVADGVLMPTRVDEEDVAPVLFESVHVPRSDLVVVQDYGKGVVTGEMMRAIRDSGMRFVVDPARGRLWVAYVGAYLIKCNLAEARLLTCGEGTRELAEQLSYGTSSNVAVTCGADGMWLAQSDEVSVHFPAEHPLHVRDACGCGDQVIATLACALAENETLHSACERAMKTASEQVKHLGATVLEEKMISCY